MPLLRTKYLAKKKKKNNKINKLVKKRSYNKKNVK